MRLPRMVETLGWVAAAGFTLAAGLTMWEAGRPPESPADLSLTSVRFRLAAQESLSSWSEMAVAKDPFRFERRPASLRFGETREPPPEIVRPATPVLRLLGTIGGPPWQAVVDGFPGRSGPVVLRPGERIYEFQVKSIARDSAVLSHPDSIWVLTVSRPLP